MYWESVRAIWRAVLAIALLLSIAVNGQAASAKPPSSPDELTLFTINELEGAPDALSLSESVPSQDWVRAWFKWGDAPDWKHLECMVRIAHQHGALFGGGVTCSVLYPHENNITKAQFMDMATRNPYGGLTLLSHSYYHGSLENPAYLRYVLKWAERQINAGADTLFMDEVNGAYSNHEGFDAYGLAAFRVYLIRRFVQHAHWSITDARWESRFHIDLSDSDECADHTIRTFNYSAYLRLNHWAGEPHQGANPLAEIWGDPSDITANTYSADRNNRAWGYWVTHIRAFAAKLHRHVWIAANGLNRWVDYQIIGSPSSFQGASDGNLVCTNSKLAHWRSAYEESRELLDGRNVPIMAFHDWGDGMPWMNLTAAERVAWLDAYAPEVFAAGLFFAYPVHGPWGLDASANGTLAVIQKQARFIESVAPLLHHIVWQDPGASVYSGVAEITIQGQPKSRRLIVHLINRDYSGMNPITQVSQELRVALAVRPITVLIHNADTGMVSRANWSYNPHLRLPGRRKDGELIVTIPSLRTWDMVEVVLPRWPVIPAPAEITISCTSCYSCRPTKSIFNIGAGSTAISGLNGVIHDQLHPEFRNNPTFIVKCQRRGLFEVHVNSVGTAGARLLVRVDGKLALAIPIANQSVKNDAKINRTYTVGVSPGLHHIMVDNDGEDWFTVDWYRFTGL